jgi:lysyl-tRNA synthetase, class II
MSSQDASIYEQERRAKLQKLRDLGVDPFGQRTEGLAPLASIKEQYKPEMGHDGGPTVKAAGRIMLKRDMGKLSFLTLRDESGDLQIGIDKRKVNDTAWEIRNNLDLGDQIAVEGVLGVTNKGETTIWATNIAMASKSLLTPPSKHEGLTDVEARYRQRYVDLWANPEVMRVLKLRIRIVDEIRTYLKSKGYTEVETPMLQSIHGGAAARPFITHHNALDMKLYLRIAPELFLKRLLVGGFSKVFEINRNFRNEGISPRHNPEFTMLEAYEAFGSWETMADMVEEMVTTVAQNVFGTLEISHRDAEGAETKKINLSRPWRRVSMVDLVAERTGWKFNKEPLTPDQIADFRASNPGKDLKLNGSPAEQLTEIYEKLIEHTLIDPCFVTHVPSVIIPLAKENKADPFFADVYELAINGQEISPGYTELNDPDTQRKHFEHQVGDREEQQHVDEDFLTALKYGMPPAGGMGLGIDRLVMMLTGAESIRDVILFPLMRPEA